MNDPFEKVATGGGYLSPVESMMQTSPAKWSPADIAGLGTRDLRTVAKMLGLPSSRHPDQLREDLVIAANLRVMLSGYGDESADVQCLADRFKLRHLRGFCRRVRIYAPSNKYGLAAALLTWRNDCRRKGEAAVKLWRAEVLLQEQGQRCFRFG